MTSFARLCGLTVRSTRPIPGLPPDPPGGVADLEVLLDVDHPWTPSATGRHPLAFRDEGVSGAASGVASGSGSVDDGGEEAALRFWRAPGDRYFRLAYQDGTVFTVDGAGRRIWVSWRPPSTFHDVSTYLLGPVLGFALRRRGVVSLHASAVAVGGGAVALAGPGGMGKSTTATAFARIGFPVLSDDLVPLVEADGELLAQPTYPRMRLWPDSVERFYGSPDALPRFSDGWEKRFLDLEPRGYSFEERPRPLTAVYCFREVPASAAGPALTPLAGQRAMMVLVHNTYVNYLLDAAMRAGELEVLARLIERVPVRALDLPGRHPDPDDLCRLILEDLDVEDLDVEDLDVEDLDVEDLGVEDLGAVGE